MKCQFPKEFGPALSSIDVPLTFLRIWLAWSTTKKLTKEKVFIKRIVARLYYKGNYTLMLTIYEHLMCLCISQFKNNVHKASHEKLKVLCQKKLLSNDLSRELSVEED